MTGSSISGLRDLTLGIITRSHLLLDLSLRARDYFTAASSISNNVFVKIRRCFAAWSTYYYVTYCFTEPRSSSSPSHFRMSSHVTATIFDCFELDCERRYKQALNTSIASKMFHQQLRIAGNEMVVSANHMQNCSAAMNAATEGLAAMPGFLEILERLNNALDEDFPGSIAHRMQRMTIQMDRMNNPESEGSLAHQIRNMNDPEFEGSLAHQIRNMNDPEFEGSLAHQIRNMNDPESEGSLAHRMTGTWSVHILIANTSSCGT